MGQPLAGTGVLLPPPQNYYPSELQNAPQDPSSNVMTLAPGGCFVIPPGNWYLHLGPQVIVQFRDPVNGCWVLPIMPVHQDKIVFSDGQNCRIANLTGCAAVATITNSGTGYAQSTTTCVASAGGSTWQPIVGGSLTISSITNVGGNYGVAPIVMIPPPPSPGLQATAVATIGTGGTVSAIACDNVGAGYLTAPPIVLVPSPFDPNLNAGITTATALATLIGSGSVTGLICTNNGNSVSSVPTLTISGAGSSAAASVSLLTTLSSVSIANAGVGYTSTIMGAGGGTPSYTATNTNPLHDGHKFVPRIPNVALTASGNSITAATIVDGGLFLGTATLVPAPNAASVSTPATLSGVQGGASGSFWMTPAP